MIKVFQFVDADFGSQGEADRALTSEGFALQVGFGIWRSRDGLIDAVVKRRYRDERFYIVLFA